MTPTTPDHEEIRNSLIRYLISNVGCDSNDVEFDQPPNDLGVGSRGALELSGQLAELVGRPISPEALWLHASPRQPVVAGQESVDAYDDFSEAELLQQPSERLN